MSPKSTTVNHVANEPVPAGFLRRTGALLYDVLLLAGILLAFTLFTYMLRGGREIPPGTLWFQACLVALIAGFFAGFWSHGGQTLGMRAWRLRVVDRNGHPLGPARALARVAAGIVALLPAGLGFLWALVDREKLGLHDRLSGTRLLHDPKPPRKRAPAAAGSG